MKMKLSNKSKQGENERKKKKERIDLFVCLFWWEGGYNGISTLDGYLIPYSVYRHDF